MVVSLSLNQARCYISIQIDVGHDLIYITSRYIYTKLLMKGIPLKNQC